MPHIADFLDRNKAVEHKPLPFIEDLKAAGSPGPRTIIVSCLDPRCIPEAFFNLHAGEALVHRNAGGNVRTALRDIVTLDSLFGLDEICIVHHTDCGTTHTTDDQVRAHVKKTADPASWPEVDKLDIWAVTDIEESVKGDLEWVRTTPFIRDELKKGTQGFVFDIKTGAVTKVEPKTAF
ncbi:carbonic anhydrase [Sporothrix schenckii 1099-18]|uniref:Carbonic anhydrase n=2 Tax=Sporothrix schenckii TaxID=29908 RepID=U7Q1G1_SPOS1|nr:carbonic anhydrase [Sporothrix schenckii 1099-18]ERT01698.1 hypothetical protein HMPREF1624_02951 [Sporothrix schenckii ATCC 58251]KJR88933.1 carbonic anhydrase [Sporothrix schenckii 1099-18]